MNHHVLCILLFIGYQAGAGITFPAGNETGSGIPGFSLSITTKNGQPVLEDKGNNMAGIMYGETLSLYLNGPANSTMVDLPGATPGKFPVVAVTKAAEKRKANIAIILTKQIGGMFRLVFHEGSLTLSSLSATSCSGHFEGTVRSFKGEQFIIKAEFKNIAIQIHKG